MKPVDMESAIVVTDYLFSELISANLFFKKKTHQNNKMAQWSGILLLTYNMHLLKFLWQWLNIV